MSEHAATDPRATSVAAEVDTIAAENPSWMKFSLQVQATFGSPLDRRARTRPPKAPSQDREADQPDDDDPDDQTSENQTASKSNAGDDPVRQAALFACSYGLSFENDDRGRSQYRLEPFFQSDSYSWPPRPDDVAADVADWWPVIAELVHAPAPKARLHGAAFLRGGRDRVLHANNGAEAYFEANRMAARKPEAVDYLQAALRLARAIRSDVLVERALTSLLNFVEDELQTSDDGLGFAIQALEIVAAEPAAPARLNELAELLSDAASYVPLADRALRILLSRAAQGDKPALWRRRVERRRTEALAADHPSVKSVKLQHALQLAQESGQTDLRDLVAADLQACARDDLGMVAFSASSFQYEEAVAEQVKAMIGAETWEDALLRLAHFGPLTGITEKNREIVRDQHAASPLLALLPVQLLGPDQLPSYTGTTPEDRFNVDLVRQEVQLLNAWLPVLARSFHDIPVRHGLPTAADLYTFLRQWPSFTQTSAEVIVVALQRLWAGDADAATYTAMPQIEGNVRDLIMSVNRGVFRAQRDHRPGQTLGLGALLPILAETHEIREDWIRYYQAALVHPAGSNLRNLLLHGFRGRTGAAAASLVLHLLLHLGTLTERVDEADDEPADE